MVQTEMVAQFGQTCCRVDYPEIEVFIPLGLSQEIFSF
jgi:hypothetical protein